MCEQTSCVVSSQQCFHAPIDGGRTRKASLECGHTPVIPYIDVPGELFKEEVL